MQLPIYAALLLAVNGASAATDTVTFEQAVVASRSAHTYMCEGSARLRVDYITTRAGDSLAYLPVSGAGHIFVAGPSGSGVRYVSGAFVWWTKGPTARLTRDDVGAGPALLDGCRIVDAGTNAAEASDDGAAAKP